ncbi:ATP-grasp domain-containing protein [Aliarcobacter butzleri]|uniref:ATP-grasp domain-containing protein n=1 Tax=Aliarcobacter butzleri TaxID=28197 RepID=UPI001EDBD023|nr:ATP-grasp domain-containing protein [Aliarcobacter butzleri]MCG3665687.1 ATP-grasp domain-containing protein [Aliarcobacter butzleri]
MFNLLILGGSHAEIPLIKSAKKLGFYVITTGNKENDLGHKYADEYIKEDFSDKEKMYELALKLKIDAICPCANDFAAISCSYVAEKLGFTHYDDYKTSLIIHHKDKFREFSIKHHLSVPMAKSFDSLEEVLNAINTFKLPIIIKPIDLSGGKGIQKIDNFNIDKVDEIVKYAFSISKAKKVVIEEFIEGTNHGLSCILINGKIQFHFCDNEHYYINRYMVSGASTPSIVPNVAINQLIKESEEIAKILKLKDGIFHIQFILKENRAHIIEICRRPPGDLYIDFVKYSTGVDYPKYLIKAFCGLDISNIEQKESTFLTRHCVMTNRNGIIKDIIYDESIKGNIIDKLMWWKVGDKIEDCMIYKAGIVFLQYGSLEEMVEKTKNLDKLIKIVLL